MRYTKRRSSPRRTQLMRECPLRKAKRRPMAAMMALAVALVLLAATACGGGEPHSVATSGSAQPSPTVTPPLIGPPLSHQLGVSDNLGHLPAAELNKRLGVLQGAGATWLRKDLEWRGANPAPGVYSWTVN